MRRIPHKVRPVGKTLGSLRTIKMVKPRCPQNECQESGFGWWNECPHDPYYSKTTTPVEEPTIEEQPDGTMLVTGVKRTVVYDVQPNVMQVPVDVSVNSGNGVNQMRINKGYKFLQDVGFAPMCEFDGCYSHDLPFTTRNGSYCTEDHAKLVLLRVQEKNLMVDAKERRKQLDEVTLI